MEIFYLSTVVVFGLITGSFLNALIYRLKTEESIVKGRSHCPHCRKLLTWYELMPVFSFIAQKGKCRGCGKKISWQYPIVEIATALLFLGIFLMSNVKVQMPNEIPITNILELLFLWVISAGLIAIFVYDLKHYLIPDKVLVPLIIITLLAELFGIWSLSLIWHFGAVFNALTLALLSAIPFALLHFLSGGKAMGFGDVKLAFFMGLFLGYPAVLTAIFVAFVLGAIIGIGLIILGQSTMKSRVPFGPFLILGTFISLFWGESLTSWYLNLFY